MRIHLPDFFLGLGALVLSLGYLLVASQIPESLLSDSVGASGVPKVLGWMLAALGLLLSVRSLKRGDRAKPGMGADSGTGEEAPEAPAGMRPHLQALGLLAILCGYTFILPYLGYPVATALLVGVLAMYCGTPFNRNLLLIAVAAGAGLWFIFHYMLGISMPVGSLMEGL